MWTSICISISVINKFIVLANSKIHMKIILATEIEVVPILGNKKVT